MHARTVIAISGEPASGKTTAATLLAETRNGLTIDTDLLCGPLRAAAMACLGLQPADVDGPLYQQRLRPAVYQSLVDTAVHLSTFGHPVIVSGPFHPLGFTADDWAAFRAQLNTAGATLQRLHLVGDAETIRQRMIIRGEPRDEGKLRDWVAYQRSWADVTAGEATTIVNDGTVDGLREKLREMFVR